MADQPTHHEAPRRVRRLRLVWSLRPGATKSRSHVSKALWVALFAGVLGVSLWQGAQRPVPSTPTARMEQVASQLRCPVCIDESAAQANTAAARAIRADIATRLRSGQSERQIIDYMVSRYGRWILLSPPSSGLGLTVWLAPIAVTLGALAVVAVAWARAVQRFRAADPGPTDTQVELNGERDLSLADRTQRVEEERAST
ncbi:MAG: cytochrome c-type biogenesis protein CcmH [Actinomycetota bacterium]|nr:cytochrome c-type biogenesis protein CcmH [Actinomycetota bacterium]